MTIDEIIPIVISIISLVVSGLSFWFTVRGFQLAVRSLGANHDWNRRNSASQMIAQWNDETSAHRRAIEQIRPGLIDLDKKSGKVVEITAADAIAIFTSKPGSDEWELRFHFVELLNYFEVLAVAYRSQVGDQQMLEESLRSTLTRWHDILTNFIRVVGEQRGYEPWEPFVAVVKHWKSTPYKPRSATA